jgi:hypothetical protein
MKNEIKCYCCQKNIGDIIWGSVKVCRVCKSLIEIKQAPSLKKGIYLNPLKIIMELNNFDENQMLITIKKCHSEELSEEK